MTLSRPVEEFLSAELNVVFQLRLQGRYAGTVHPCCPAGRGCNAVDRDEDCVLALCRVFTADEPAAELALARWDAFEDACEHHPVSDGEQRFRRRSYERARDRALSAITMRTTARLIDSQITATAAALRAFARRFDRVGGTAVTI